MNLSVHKTYEKSEDSKREMTIRVAGDTGSVTRLTGTDKIQGWVDSVNPGTTVRFTAVHAQDPIINLLVDKGVNVEYANWHKTGLAKNLTPDEITVGFSQLPDSTFRKFTPRPDLTELRFRVGQRSAIMEYAKACMLKIRGLSRDFGKVNEEDLDEEVKNVLEEAEKIDIKVLVKGRKVSIDTVIANLAKEIRECRLFNAAAFISDNAWNTAAAVVALSGGIDRFDNVASFWHYCGQDPTSNKRKKGQAVSYSPKLKTILWNTSEFVVKNRSNPWRDFYDQELKKELALHPQKHPICKKKKSADPRSGDLGHCMNLAKVKMRKEILKRFFLAVKGEEYREQLISE